MLALRDAADATATADTRRRVPAALAQLSAVPPAHLEPNEAADTALHDAGAAVAAAAAWPAAEQLELLGAAGDVLPLLLHGPRGRVKRGWATDGSFFAFAQPLADAVVAAESTYGSEESIIQAAVAQERLRLWCAEFWPRAAAAVETPAGAAAVLRGCRLLRQHIDEHEAAPLQEAVFEPVLAKLEAERDNISGEVGIEVAGALARRRPHEDETLTVPASVLNAITSAAATALETRKVPMKAKRHLLNAVQLLGSADDASRLHTALFDTLARRVTGMRNVTTILDILRGVIRARAVAREPAARALVATIVFKWATLPHNALVGALLRAMRTAGLDDGGVVQYRMLWRLQELAPSLGARTACAAVAQLALFKAPVAAPCVAALARTLEATHADLKPSASVYVAAWLIKLGGDVADMPQVLQAAAAFVPEGAGSVIVEVRIGVL